MKKYRNFWLTEAINNNLKITLKILTKINIRSFTIFDLAMIFTGTVNKERTRANCVSRKNVN